MSLDWLPTAAETFIRTVAKLGLRYGVAAGFLYLLFYVWKRRAWFHHKIQLKTPESRQLRHELTWSALTLLVFGVVSALVKVTGLRGQFLLYDDISTHGWLYYGLSVAGMIFWHDAYFYWTHRLLHTRWLLKHVHSVHHKSTDPTPWAAFSFHPVEAIIQTGFIYTAPLVIPLHPSVLVVVVLYQMFFNTLGHLGYEMYPRAYVRHPLTFWNNTSTHHNLHHLRSNWNFGLYFNLWDRWMGTNHPEYLQTFDRVASQTPEMVAPLLDRDSTDNPHLITRTAS